ncbi:hypothetical protein A6R68_02627 [Neotoma lepida]|uniref:Centromere protein M n=1 Tax=Neotoma lepida TaxID=56216 RepID=A0A1A6GU26_NEOLE|nr:hypothetical protein A6R68_02627 [Neotoma lepida]
MSVLRPMDKLPDLNGATILLVGTEDALLQRLAESMLKDHCASELRVHLANSLPLPSNVNRPRIDLIVFVINLHSKHSIHRNTVIKLAHTYRSPLLFCDLEVESFRATVAQRLVRMLQICAGHVPGISALNLLSLLRSSNSPPPKEL